MRNIINISLPPGLKNDVDEAMKTGDYASRSDFFRDLLRLWKEHKLYSDVMESEREFEQGKGKLLTSFKDLR